MPDEQQGTEWYGAQIDTTAYPAAYLVTVKRRPAQTFITRDKGVLDQATATFDRLGWEYQVREFWFITPTAVARVQDAAPDLLEVAQGVLELYGRQSAVWKEEIFVASPALLKAAREAVAKATGKAVCTSCGHLFPTQDATRGYTQCELCEFKTFAATHGRRS